MRCLILHLQTVTQLEDKMERITINNLKGLSHKDQVRFALFCAYQIKSKWENIPSSVEAIRLTELWLEGKATVEECCFIAGVAGTDAFMFNANIAASSAAYAVGSGAPWANACDSAISANYGIFLDSISIIKEQWKYFYELRDFDKIAEQILLNNNNTVNL
jgi:hypothetical protein